MASIRRDELQKLDMSDTTGERLPPVHIGTILLEEFMEPMDLSVKALAAALDMPQDHLRGVLDGQFDVTADMALRLSRHFGTSAGFWLNLQAAYERDVAQDQEEATNPRS